MNECVEFELVFSSLETLCHYLLFIFVPTIENGEELCFQVFFFVFHAKSGTTNNDRTGLCGTSY